MKLSKKIRHIIRWLTPFGVVHWYTRNHPKEHPVQKIFSSEQIFVSDFKKYVSEQKYVTFENQSPFETVVAVQGFGYSGSGAVVDLLREYDNTLVIGSVDYEGSVASRDKHCEEVDILRLAGGLFEVEKYLGSNNIFQNDALLHRVVAQIANSDIYESIPSVHPYFYEYLRQICSIVSDSPRDQYYNQFLDYRGNNDIFFLNSIPIHKYREICRGLLNSIFSIIKGDDKCPILVLDQFVGDVEFDVNRYLDYIPNLKILTVYRDPRDVYLFAKLNNVEWIPHTMIEMFIDWYKVLTKNFNINETEKYHVVQFEQLLDDYDDVVSSIEKFVGTTSLNHARKAACLDVNVSKKNKSLWMQNNSRYAEYDFINKELKQFCYCNKQYE